MRGKNFQSLKLWQNNFNRGYVLFLSPSKEISSIVAIIRLCECPSARGVIGERIEKRRLIDEKLVRLAAIRLQPVGIDKGCKGTSSCIWRLMVPFKNLYVFQTDYIWRDNRGSTITTGSRNQPATVSSSSSTPIYRHGTHQRSGEGHFFHC